MKNWMANNLSIEKFINMHRMTQLIQKCFMYKFAKRNVNENEMKKKERKEESSKALKKRSPFVIHISSYNKWETCWNLYYSFGIFMVL